MYLTSTQKVTITTSAAVTVDVWVAAIDMIDYATKASQYSEPVPLPGFNITTAADTDIIPVPSANDIRMVKDINVRNKHATTPVDVTVKILDSGAGPDVELIKLTLRAGETLEWHDNGLGWNVLVSVGKMWRNLRVAGSDYVNATTSFTDITGLTCPVESGKFYNFVAYLFHQENAATTGAQFAIGGVAMTAMHLQEIGVVIPSVTAATMQSSAGVTAINTAAVVATASATTPANHLAILAGYFNPSASGTLAIRGASEVAVAAGLTVRVGSFAQIWEADA